MDKVGAVGQQSLDDVDVHFVAVPTDRVIAVNIPVTVHKILHITAILFAVDFDLLEINCFASVSRAKSSSATSCADSM